MFNYDGSLFVNDTYPSVWGLTYLFLKGQSFEDQALDHLDYYRVKHSIPSIFD